MDVDVDVEVPVEVEVPVAIPVPVAGLSSLPPTSLILTVISCVEAFELASVAVTVAVMSYVLPS